MPSTHTESAQTRGKPPVPARQRRRDSRMLKACSVLLIALMLATCFAPAITIAKNDGRSKASRAAVSQEFADYLKSPGSHRPVAGTPDVGNAGHSTGLIPNPVSLSHLSGRQLSDKIAKDRSDSTADVTSFNTVKSSSSVGSTGTTGSAGSSGSDSAWSGLVSSSFPATYDLRELGKVTGVRNQGSSGSCWAFATYASMESYLLTNETADFSENNLKNTHGFNWEANDGGNGFISTAYLTRWDGPVTETADPYNPLSTSSPALAPAKRVQDVFFLPARTGSLDNGNIKAALMAYGAVYITYLADESPEYYNPANASYYMPTYLYWPNHAVAVVGWDDGYSRFNFATTPPGDGAFIVKNSWGAGWGDEGYFYVSYYDAVLGRDGSEGMLVFTADPLEEYDHVYYHDEFGLTENWGFGSDTAWFATVYTAEDGQYLDAVGFYAAEADSEYMVRVYVDGALEQTTSGTLGLPGYRTVRLNESVPLAAGEKFRIEVRLRTPGFNYPVPVEGRVSGYTSNATANASESFYGSDGVYWYDAMADAPYGASPYSDVCLKAYTSDANGLFQFTQPSYTVSENAGTATITVARDTAPGPASVNYSTASGTATTRDFTPVTGTLHFAAGETSKTFAVPVLGDDVLEGSETVTLSLSGATNESRLGSLSTATLILADGEAAPAAIPETLGFAASEQDGAVSVIDVANNTVIARLDAGDSPRAVAVSPGGAYAYVTDNASGRLWKLDARGLSRLNSVYVGSEPYDIAISPDGCKAAVAARGDDSVAIIDLRSFTVARTVAAGASPEAVAFSANSSLIYAANRGGSDVTVINATTGAASPLGTGANPTGIAVSPDGRAYVACAGSSNLTVIAGDGSISNITLEGPARDVAVSPDGYYAYVSLTGNNAVDILGLWPADPVAQATVNAPGSLSLSEDGGTLYAAETGSRSIAVIQAPDGTVAGTITAGNTTTGLALGPAYQAPVFSFAGTAYSINRSATNLTITINRQGCLDRPDSVGISVLSGNATAGVDYVSLPGTVQFSNGVSARTINLTVKQSSQGDRTLVLGLSGSGDAAIGANSTAAIAIVEDRTEALTYDLVVGWNLISLPVEPENAEITELFPEDVRAGVVDIWGWDEATQNWVYYCPDPNDYFYQYYPALTELETGKAYWVEMNKSASVTIQGITPAYAPASQTGLVSGWSFVGITGTSPQTTGSMYQNVIDVWGWDESTQNWVYYCPDPNDYFYQYYPALDTVKPGHGYWVEKN